MEGEIQNTSVYVKYVEGVTVIFVDVVRVCGAKF